jgi:hypothetical protein
MDKENLNSRTHAFLHSFGITDKKLSIRAIQDFNVGIIADPEILQSYSGQLMLLVLANILPRMWPSVTFPVSPQINRIVMTPLSNAPDLAVAIMETARIASGAVGYTLKSSDSPNFIIAIGPAKRQADVYINADGWVAYISNQSIDVLFCPSAGNPFGPIAAACFGAAEAFRAFLRKLGCTNGIAQRPVSTFRYSVLRGLGSQATNANVPLPSKVSLGEFTLVGAGAVGSSLVYTLAIVPKLGGTIHILDDETIDGPNLNRYLIARLADIGVKKAILAAKILNGKIKVEPFYGSYETYPGRQNIPLLVSTVDNRNQNATRRAIQSDLPRLILHGATGEEKVSVARLDFSSGACLGCLFPLETNPIIGELSRLFEISPEEAEQLLSEDQCFSEEHAYRLSARTMINAIELLKHVGKPFMKVFQNNVCGNLNVQIEGKRIEAAVPFVSLMAGVMLAAELIKESCPELHIYRLSNYRKMSLFGQKQENEWVFFRKKERACSCYCQEEILQKRFKRKWKL